MIVLKISMLCFVLMLVLVLLTAGAPKDSIIGKWGSHDGDSMEFGSAGIGNIFNHRLGKTANFKWEIIADSTIKFSHPMKNLSRDCRFAIYEMAIYDLITISKCRIETSQGIVNNWSGRKGIVLAGE